MKLDSKIIHPFFHKKIKNKDSNAIHEATRYKNVMVDLLESNYYIMNNWWVIDLL